MTPPRARGFVLLAAIAFIGQGIVPMAGAQDVDPGFVIEDPAGDVKPSNLLTGPAPTPDLVGLPPTDNVDIAALRILSEDSERLLFALEMQDLSSPVRNSDAQDLLSYTFVFRLASHPVTYRVAWSAFGLTYMPAVNPSDEPRPIGGSLCVMEETDTGSSPCFSQDATVYLDLAEDRFLVDIPKESLVARNPVSDDQTPPRGIPASLPVGEGLNGWQFSAVKRSLVLSLAIAGAFVYLEDRAPNDGPSDEVYRLKVPAANSIVRLVAPVGDPEPSTFICSGVCLVGSYASPETPGASVTPGSTAGIPITVHNQAATKRLVNLTVRMDEPDPAWSFQLAPAIEVPAGKSRTVTLLVNASQTVAHKDSVRVVVEGRSLGHPEEMGRAELLIAAAVTPSPQQATLYLHASELTPEGAVVEGCYPLLACFNQYSFWMNTLEDDEQANIDEVGYEDYRLHSLGPLVGDEQIVFQQYFVLDTPIARGIFMDSSEPATMSVRFSAPRAIDGTIRASIGLTDQARCDSFACGNYVPLADGSTSGTIEADDTFTFSLPINPEFARVAPDDGRLAVLIQLSSSDPLATLNQADGIRFHPAGSQVTLPVAVDPEADDDGPSLIGLYRGSDPEEFLNPGKARAFHVVATNEGVDADRIQLTAELDQEGWTAAFKPGDRYELAAGASVNVTMLVTAPAAAKEGDRTTIVVWASSLNQTDSSSRVSFVAIATTGVQIEDESTTYDVDEDAAERVYQEPEGASPGLPLVALVAGLAVAVALRRRI